MSFLDQGGAKEESCDMPNVEMDEKRSLWSQILGLLEDDLAQRRSAKVFVRVYDQSGFHLKEVSELSIPERQSLDPGLREYVVEQLLDRHLAEQGYVDLLKNRRHYTKRIRDITPQDLPALVEAEKYKADEHGRRQEQEEFVREVHEDLERLQLIA
jgi:hypothetical protein